MRHVKALIGTRKYLWPAVFVGGGLFLLGSTTGNPIVAVVPLLIVLAVLGIRMWREATRLAARDFFVGYAVERHFNYSESMIVVASTPLLAAGDRRRCEHYIEGELEGVPGASVGLAHFVFETQEHKHDRRNRPIAIFTPHDYTVAMVDLQRPSSVFPGIYLQRRTGVLARADWLDRKSLVPATLDHSALAHRCELLVTQGQDPDRLRRLMRTDLQAMLAESPMQPGLEYHEGMLVVYVPGKVRGPDQLDGLIKLTALIANRLQEEGEPLRVVEPVRSVSPPGVGGAFPPPPPATKPHVEPALRVAPTPSAPTPVVSDLGRASIPPPSA